MKRLTLGICLMVLVTWSSAVAQKVVDPVNGARINSEKINSLLGGTAPDEYKKYQEWKAKHPDASKPYDNKHPFALAYGEFLKGYDSYLKQPFGVGYDVRKVKGSGEVYAHWSAAFRDYDKCVRDVQAAYDNHTLNVLLLGKLQETRKAFLQASIDFQKDSQDRLTAHPEDPEAKEAATALVGLEDFLKVSIANRNLIAGYEALQNTIGDYNDLVAQLNKAVSSDAYNKGGARPAANPRLLAQKIEATNQKRAELLEAVEEFAKVVQELVATGHPLQALLQDVQIMKSGLQSMESLLNKAQDIFENFYAVDP